MKDHHHTPSTWAYIADAAVKGQNVSLGVLGIAIALVTYFVAPDAKAPLWALFFLGLASLFILVIFLAAMKALASERGLALPSVLTTVKAAADDEPPVLLLEPSPLFGSSTLVSVYHRDKANGFEVLMAHGTVRTVQSDMKIQVKIDEWTKGNDQIVSAISNNNTETLGQLIVRPSVSRGQTSHDEIYKELLLHQSRASKILTNLYISSNLAGKENGNE